MRFTVSVIIPTFNYGRFIVPAIESVLAQTYPIAEIIVVDDGSSDDTELVVKAFREKVRYIKQKNAGVGEARNNGVRNSTGDLVAFLDADDCWLPTKIEKQVQKFLESDQIGLVHCGLREFDTNSGKILTESVNGKEGDLSEDLLMFEPNVIIGPGSTSLIKRSLFDEIGGYDTDRSLHPSEDWEFSYRLSRKCRFGFVPEALVDYRNHGLNAHLNIDRFEHSTNTAWAKVFDTTDDNVLRLRRRSYGVLHKVLAGSYLQNGQYTGFVRNLLKSIWYRPEYLSYYASLLLIRLNRRQPKDE